VHAAIARLAVTECGLVRGRTAPDRAPILTSWFPASNQQYEERNLGLGPCLADCEPVLRLREVQPSGAPNLTTVTFGDANPLLGLKRHWNRLGESQRASRESPLFKRVGDTQTKAQAALSSLSEVSTKQAEF
jgi:hypothetical protein